MSRISDTGKASQSHSLRRIIYPNSCIHSPTNRVESFWGFIQWPHSFVDQRLIHFLSLQAVGSPLTSQWGYPRPPGGFLRLTGFHCYCPQDYNLVAQGADHPSLGPALRSMLRGRLLVSPSRPPIAFGLPGYTPQHDTANAASLSTSVSPASWNWDTATVKHL